MKNNFNITTIIKIVAILIGGLMLSAIVYKAIYPNDYQEPRYRANQK